MAYLIEKYEKETPIKGVFFFDTNIWYYVLSDMKKLQEETKYVSLFEKVHDAPYAKIAVSTVLFSELINTYMKKIAFPYYLKATNTTIKYDQYKERYRPTQDYADALETVCDDIAGYSKSFVFLPNIDEELDLLDLTNYPKLDFNDYLFYKQCQKMDYTIVSNDKDFFVEDVNVLTLNKKLLERKMEQLIKERRP